MKPMTFALLCTIISFACGDTSTDTAGMSITTIITTNGQTSEMSTSATSTSTTSTSTSDPTTGNDTTAGPQWDCLDEGYNCAFAPTDENFCAYVVEACAAHEIPETYCKILETKCPDPAYALCDSCFYLANTCYQLGVDCGDLMAECACVAGGLGGEQPPDETTGTTGTTDTTDTTGVVDSSTTSTTSTTTGEALDICGDAGMLFGTCLDGQCIPPFSCNTSQGGEMCIPPAWYAKTHPSEVVDCAATIGGDLDCETLQSAWCMVRCGDDQACDGDAECDQLVGICAYPHEP